jgi:uncharacterized protein with ParB-like and HNH nuclease domain
MKFTPTSLTINQLFNSANEQYLILTYQRRYSWTQKQIWDLIEDVGQIEAGDQHLLGMLVCLAGHHRAGLNQLEVVDGQQRLTTIVILLECIRQRFEKEGLVDAARDISTLLQAVPPSGKSEEKVLLDSIDADEFKDHVAARVDRTYINERLSDAFRLIREEAIEEAVSEYTIKGIQEFVYKLRNQAVVVRLDVSEARDAFKLFETINNRGLRLSPTDIVKNFLLGNAARFGNTPLDQARKSWAELLHHLDGINADAFLRYYLMSLLQVRVKKIEVVSRFKTLFMTQVAEAAKLPDRHNYPDMDDSEDKDEGANGEDASNAESELSRTEAISFSDFLERLVQSAKCYGEIEFAKTNDTYLGSNSESQHPKFVDRIGNLTLFAGALNIGASNNPFVRKKAA